MEKTVNYFKCEEISFAEISKLPVDTLLDLYNDYTTMYNITKDTKFKGRAFIYMHILKNKPKEKEVS